MIITDGTHLISNSSLEELHEFAQKIGLKKQWFQDNPNHPHYDLTTKRMFAKAIRSGAEMTTPRELLKRIQEIQNKKEAINDDYLCWREGLSKGDNE